MAFPGEWLEERESVCGRRSAVPAREEHLHARLVVLAGLVPAGDGFSDQALRLRAFGGCLGAKRR